MKRILYVAMGVTFAAAAYWFAAGGGNETVHAPTGGFRHVRYVGADGLERIGVQFD